MSREYQQTFVVRGAIHYQRAVSALAEGQPLELAREPHNQYDPNAIALRSPSGDLVGYVPAELAAVWARLLDKGYRRAARVAAILEPEPDYPGIGLEAEIRIAPPIAPESNVAQEASPANAPYTIEPAGHPVDHAPSRHFEPEHLRFLENIRIDPNKPAHAPAITPEAMYLASVAAGDTVGRYMYERKFLPWPIRFVTDAVAGLYALFAVAAALLSLCLAGLIVYIILTVVF